MYSSFATEEKKKAIRFKCSKITVIAVNAKKGIPKGKYRKELKDQEHEKNIEFKRNFSSQEVKNEIIRAFNFSDYCFLSCAPDGKLATSKNQLPTEYELIEGITKRKFPLYIEKINQVSNMYW